MNEDVHKVEVIPTDTMYGIVAPALDTEAVERVYTIKGRAPEKPCIILISAISDLSLFGIDPDEKTLSILRSVWPGKISVVLSCTSPEFLYLTRGTKSLAFRMPKDEKLLRRIKAVGPLIAPSANKEGQDPAKTIDEARHYFGEKVDAYEDGGTLDGPPSTLIDVRDGTVVVLRQGAVRIQYKS